MSDTTEPRVFLVGAGPGDPGLLTIRAAELLARADLVLYDQLVPRRTLDLANPAAERVCVRDLPGQHPDKYPHIHARLIEAARAGKTVVRLKGGDPLVFGRGGEEAAWLARHGVPFEIVPGITAALGCAAYAGIPLTDRRFAETLHFVTAHGAEAVDNVDWQRLAGRRQTLVVYMGVAAAARVQQRLLEARLPASTPAAVVENGTRPAQRVLLTDLGRLGTAAAAAGIASPALLIIGESAGEAARLGWFGPPPIVEDVRKTA